MAEINKWLVTGTAGFIGFHVCERLLGEGVETIGLDSLSPYYDPSLKQARIQLLQNRKGFSFYRMDLSDRERVEDLFRNHVPDVVVHLAAQPGVRHSLVDPHSYVDSNLVAFLNTIDCSRRYGVPHFVYASSSSVYGANQRVPFSIHDGVDHPLSLYAATKRANELIAHVYSHLFDLPTSGLRFFTVYGPWGRPDMAYFRFAEAIVKGDPITIYGDGSALRDFTYIDDAVESVVRVANRPPQGDPTRSFSAADPAISPAPFRLFNIGRGSQSSISELILLLERNLGRTAIRVHEPEQPGDLPSTSADPDDLVDQIGFEPQVGLEEGIGRFTKWFLDYRAGKSPA